MTEKSITQKLLDLVADDRFARIEALATRPNLFRIVGRTYTETWHSMFLGWLMDPDGSHGLKGYPIKRLLLALTNPTIQGEGTHFEQLVKLASLGNLDNAKVYPNEYNQMEFSCPAGRIDVFIENLEFNDGLKASILIEQKVNAQIDKGQCKKYANWLCGRNPNDLKVFVIVAPDDRLKGSAEDTIGDSRWCGINYQVLHDVILVPLSKHPGLSSHTAPLIAQYIDALRVPINGRKLAVTEEERELALDLYEKHKDAFEALNAALAESTDLNLVAAHSQKTVLSVKINSDEIKGNTVTELYQNALKYIKEKGINIESQLPYATSEKRFLIAKSPFHPEDKKFRVPVETDGYFMEAHKNRIQAVKDLARFFKKLGLKAEISQ